MAAYVGIGWYRNRELSVVVDNIAKMLLLVNKRLWQQPLNKSLRNYQRHCGAETSCWQKVGGNLNDTTACLHPGKRVFFCLFAQVMRSCRTGKERTMHNGGRHHQTNFPFARRYENVRRWSLLHMTEGLDNSVCVGLLYSKDWRRAKQQRQSTETQMGVGSAKALLEVRGREIEGNAV